MSTPINYTQMSLAGISGYDFSGITQAMVNNYSLPLNQLNDSQKALETKKNAWRDINTRMASLEKILDKLRDPATWKATKATSSNPNAVAATSTSGAMNGTYNIVVTQTALAQTVTGDAQSVAAANTGLGMGAGTISVQVGETVKDISISANASLQDIAQAINDAKAGVDATVVKTGDGFRLALISKETGVEKAAQFSDTSGNILESIGVLDSVGGAKNVTQTARDAVISVNGLNDITSSNNVFNDVIKGVTLELTGATAGSTVTVKIEADASAAEETIKSFVDQYNSLNAFLNEKTQYNPDTKIKGELFADPMVNSLRSQLRSMLSGDFGMDGEGGFSHLSQVGLSTSSVNFGKEGMLEFNAEKFNKAMAEDPEGVMNFLGGGSGDMAAKGLASTYKAFVHDYIMADGRLSKTIKSYDNQLADVKRRIEDFNQRIEEYTKNIKLKFARLEAMLANLDGQRESIAAQMSQLSALKS
ncbi:MAG: flagellar filament capping protein FliD [Peptococcaceae bacterium]|nr:flagellar filament capping protein FliD [Peptococcaceae bacterium]